MKTPLVSVIIPTYNRMDTIGRAVISVLSQTWNPIELIVVDDGSTDNTLDALREHRHRIKLICQENRGSGAARNTGIRAATGDIISFLDSDDTWLPEKTERQVKLLQRTESATVGCCICNTRMFPASGPAFTSFSIADLHPKCGEGVWKNPLEILLTRFLLFNQAAAIRRNALAQVGGFRENLRILEDYDLALRLSLSTSWAFIADPLVEWHGGAANSLTGNASEADALTRSYEILMELNRTDPGSLEPAQALLKSRIRLLSWQIRALSLASRATPFVRDAGRIMMQGLRKYKSIKDRLPSYPKMITATA